MIWVEGIRRRLGQLAPGTVHNDKPKDWQRRKLYGRRRKRHGKGSGGNVKNVSLNNNERNRMALQPETVIEILWRRLRPFIGDASVDQADGAIQAAAEEICGVHELSVDCWCHPRVVVVEGAS